jgi:predicted secreted Zn-dependent protease
VTCQRQLLTLRFQKGKINKNKVLGVGVMKRVMLVLGIVCASVFSNPFSSISQSQAKVVLKEKIKYYSVTGSTGAELYKSMVKNGPDHGGAKRNVLASTSFKFNFENDVFTIRRNRCILTNLDIVVDVTYTYPRWRGSKNASPETRRAWKNFEKAAIIHEKEHVKITRKFAKDYEKALMKSRRKASDDCAKQSVGELFRTSYQIRKHERLHKRFDKRDLGKRGRGYKALLELVKAK